MGMVLLFRIQFNSQRKMTVNNQYYLSCIISVEKISLSLAQNGCYIHGCMLMQSNQYNVKVHVAMINGF